MATQFGIKYALHILSSHFGDRVCKVCECLLRHGVLTFQNIRQYTQLDVVQAKYSLLVLIQHSCVQAFNAEIPGGSGEGPKVTQYLAVFDNIIHRTRFSKFLAIVTRELDNNCREVFEGLLQHGRLTIKQMVDRAQSKKTEGSVEDVVRESLSKLLVGRFVERCPIPEPIIEPIETEQPAKKRGAKYKIFEEPESADQRILAAATPMDTLRFSIDEINPTGIIVGEKRKHDALESYKDDYVEDQHVMLRPNFEEFTRRLRHKACIENVRSRLDDGAAIVLSAILEATRSKEKKVKTENSGPLSIDAIHGEVVKSEEGRSMTYDRIRVSLRQLGCSSCGTGSDELYSVDLKTIIELAQIEEIESIVLKRYGRDAYSIFRLLVKARCLLETDKISGASFVQKKDAPKILNKLWKDEYLEMEKVITTGARQSYFMLWKVNKPTLWEHVLDEMYHAALNLGLRVAYELEREKEILILPVDQRTGVLKEKYDRLVKVRILLESSLMKLDDAIMIFHNF